MTDVATDMLGRPTKLESMIPKLDFVFQSRVPLSRRLPWETWAGWACA